MLGKLVVLLVAGVSVFLGVQFNNLIQDDPVPVMKDTWWGPGAPGKDDVTIRPFRINIDDKVLLDLKQRLEKARPLTTSLENSKQHYGMNANLLGEIVTFWKTKYNWKQREEYLNKYHQFKTQIQGLQIHYIHVKPEVKKGIRIVPLLLLHGWPGSVREFYEMIPLLTTPRKDVDFVFEVIVPSLPGYGFSQAASKQGLHTAEVAVVFKNLMARLGFNKYYIQGGDWGAIIVSNMAALFPDRVLGVHSNMCGANGPLANLKILLGSIYPPLVVEAKHQAKMYPLSNFLKNFWAEFGYMHLQATKPDTVGVGLNDSPVGLAAYIIEKFTTWTNPAWKDRDDGGLKIKYKYEDLLDNVMIYWVTNSIATSMRLYAETLSDNMFMLEKVPITVPSACARFRYELAYQSDYILKDKFRNLVQSTDLEEGGHFAAFEVPKILADDVWQAVKKMEANAKKADQ